MKTMVQIMAEDRRQQRHYQKNISKAFFDRTRPRDEKDANAYISDGKNQPLSLGIIPVAKNRKTRIINSSR